MGNQPSAPVVPAFAPSDLLFFFVAMFGFLHFLTGMLALFLEVDMLYGTLLEVAKFKVPALEKGTWYGFLRGPKKNGRGTAPNVRAWGARQATLAVPYVFALMTGEQIAYQIALVCLVGRITGDILQNILDGCYWKVGLFLGFEGPALFMLYTQAM